MLVFYICYNTKQVIIFFAEILSNLFSVSNDLSLVLNFNIISSALYSRPIFYMTNETTKYNIHFLYRTEFFFHILYSEVKTLLSCYIFTRYFTNSWKTQNVKFELVFHRETHIFFGKTVVFLSNVMVTIWTILTQQCPYLFYYYLHIIFPTRLTRSVLFVYRFRIYLECIYIYTPIRTNPHTHLLHPLTEELQNVLFAIYGF